MIDRIFSSLRTSEWITLSLFTFFMVVSWLRPMPAGRRLHVAGLGVIGTVLTLTIVFYSQGGSGSFLAVARDLIPALLILFVYWQAGRFVLPPNDWIQKTFLQVDELLIGPILRHQRTRGIQGYLEFAYLLCYPLVPLGVGALYLAGEQHSVDKYWTIVLSATYLCYAPLPFLQMLPPRLLLGQVEQVPHHHALRLLNLRILKHASIQVNTFPSAHVASTFAAALVVLYFSPVVGTAFLVLALGIAAGAVLGRYHYAADVLFGIAFATIISLL